MVDLVEQESRRRRRLSCIWDQALKKSWQHWWSAELDAQQHNTRTQDIGFPGSQGEGASSIEYDVID